MGREEAFRAMRATLEGVMLEELNGLPLEECIGQIRDLGAAVEAWAKHRSWSSAIEMQAWFQKMGRRAAATSRDKDSSKE